jgi:hypothetical protein
MKDLYDNKILAQREIDRAGAAFSVTAWEYRKAAANNADESIISALKIKLDGDRNRLESARINHDEVMESWYKFKPSDRNKIGTVMLPQNVYIR